MRETISVPTATRTSYWTAIREAIRGSQQDFTEGSLRRAIVLLAIPMVLEMVMESLFAVVDTFWVAHLGANAMATVGLTESVLMLVYCGAMGLSMSATAMVARRIGEKDSKGAAVAAVQAILVGAVASVLVAVGGSAIAPKLLEIMGASPDVIAIGRHYAAIMMGSTVAIVLLFLNNGIFRGAGGAAVATTIGRSIGVVYQMWVLFSGHSRVKILPRQFRVHWDVMARLIRVALNGMFQYGIGQLSWMFLVRLVSTFGSVAVAGYTVAIRIFFFAILPPWGLSGAAATLVGQNLGAQKPERAERSVWLTGFYNMIFLGAVGLVFIFFPEPIIRVFTRDPAVISFGVDCLRIICYGNLAYAYGMVMVQSFNGAGDTLTPTIVNLFGYWLFQIPVAYLLASRTSLGPQGVFYAIPIAETAIAIVGVALFKRGRWKL